MKGVAPSRWHSASSASDSARGSAHGHAWRRGRLDGGTGPVGGQLQRGGAPGSCCASRRAAPPAPRPAATRAARRRSRRTGPAARGSGEGWPWREGLVERGQLAHQHAHGPAVGDDVVHGQQQHVLAARPAAAARRAAAGPRRGRRAAAPPRRPAAGPPPRARPRAAARRSTTRAGAAAGGRDDLHGLAVLGAEGGAQGLVAAHQLLEARARSAATSSAPSRRTAAGML